jgi:hypothetical protein
METKVGYSFDLLVGVDDISIDISSPSSDLIHPSDFGMIKMGRNFAPKITQITGRQE